MSECYAVQIVNNGTTMVVLVDANFYQIENGFVSFYDDKYELIASYSCDIVDFVRIQLSEIDDE